MIGTCWSVDTGEALLCVRWYARRLRFDTWDEELGDAMSWFGKKAVFPTESKWNLFQGENNGKPMIVRKNESARALKETGTFRNRIGVAVPLIDAREDGLPSPLELENLNAIED